jgi:hypothetical protein
MDSLWHLGDELRGQPKVVEDRQWSLMTSKLAEITRSKGERMNDLDYARMNTVPDAKQWDKTSYQHHNESRMDHINLGLMNLDLKMNEAATAMKLPFHNMPYNMNPMYPKGSNVNAFKMNVGVNKYSSSPNGKDANGKNNGGSNNNGGNSNGSANSNSAVDKRFKTLPTSEMLPRNEVLGGYIFVCNNDTMQEDLKRQLFGMCCMLLYLLRNQMITVLENSFDSSVYTNLIMVSQDLLLFCRIASKIS